MRCPGCPVPPGVACQGETLPQRCGDPRYRDLFARMARGETPGPSRQMLLSRAARSCLYREACGCVYAQCHWKGRKVSPQECAECLSGG